NSGFLIAYGRAGRPCPRCRTALKRITLGGRGTTYCPTCQRR
ncbi:MAG: zinc finger domain-containing protein, partial [Actinomycetota bacterium]